jgi:hypothetical protein
MILSKATKLNLIHVQFFIILNNILFELLLKYFS